MKRKIIRIDDEKCNGCGLCVTACHEGAIRLIDGKARLVSEVYCDGLGACLGECPQGAITIEERDAAAFDPEAVQAHLARQRHGQGGQPVRPAVRPAGCPGMAVASFAAAAAASRPAPATADAPAASSASELRQWPVQLHLVPVTAPYWQDADLLLAADCVPVAFGGFHRELLRDRRLIIACPKLDDTSEYVEKLTAILAQNSIRSVTVAHMEVPCCRGLVRIVEAALAGCGKAVPCRLVEIGVRGAVLGERGLAAAASTCACAGHRA